MDMGDGEKFVLRPMNTCPPHRLQAPCALLPQLPIRIAEIGMMHRYEKSGAAGRQRGGVSNVSGRMMVYRYR